MEVVQTLAAKGGDKLPDNVDAVTSASVVTAQFPQTDYTPKCFSQDTDNNRVRAFFFSKRRRYPGRRGGRESAPLPFTIDTLDNRKTIVCRREHLCAAAGYPTLYRLTGFENIFLMNII